MTPVGVVVTTRGRERVKVKKEEGKRGEGEILSWCLLSPSPFVVGTTKYKFFLSKIFFMLTIP